MDLTRRGLGKISSLAACRLMTRSMYGVIMEMLAHLRQSESAHARGSKPIVLANMGIPRDWPGPPLLVHPLRSDDSETSVSPLQNLKGDNVPKMLLLAKYPYGHASAMAPRRRLGLGAELAAHPALAPTAAAHILHWHRRRPVPDACGSFVLSLTRPHTTVATYSGRGDPTRMNTRMTESESDSEPALG